MNPLLLVPGPRAPGDDVLPTGTAEAIGVEAACRGSLTQRVPRSAHHENASTAPVFVTLEASGVIVSVEFQIGPQFLYVWVADRMFAMIFRPRLAGWLTRPEGLLPCGGVSFRFTPAAGITLTAKNVTAAVPARCLAELRHRLHQPPGPASSH